MDPPLYRLINFINPCTICLMLTCNYRPNPKDGESTVFTGVCLSTHGGATPVPGSFSVPRSWPKGYPSPGLGVNPVLARRYPSPSQGRGCPITGYPSQDRTGVPPGKDWSTLPPPPHDRTAVGAFSTRRAVYLLRLRRKTFLFRLK